MSYIKRKSQKQEKRTAKEFGGKTVIASGALWSCKGDVRTDDFLIENKFTDKGYYSLKASIWEKITKEATKDNFRIPLMQIDIKNLSLVVIAESDLLGLTEDELSDRKSTRLNSSHDNISYAVFCLKKKNTTSRDYSH